MSLMIDAHEVTAWAGGMTAVTSSLEGDLAGTMNALAERGAAYASANAPYAEGTLSESIHVIEHASAGNLSASYGTDLVYAWMREEGGTITATNAPYLVFQVDGHWVKVRQVTQEGTHYMQRSMEQLEPEVDQALADTVIVALAGV